LILTNKKPVRGFFCRKAGGIVDEKEKVFGCVEETQGAIENTLDETADIEQKLVNLLIRIIVNKTLSEYYEKSNQIFKV
jgi:hypothetical protein